MVEHRTALITGAAQGIGLAAADRLAEAGVSRFVLIDRQADVLAESADALRARGFEVEALPLDLVDIETVIEETRAACERLGRIDILVNAAGVTDRGTLATTTRTTFDRILAVNMRAPFFLMQTVVPHMPRGGVVINIASMLAYGGPPFLLAYSASKGGLVTMTKGAANALRREGIRVFAINLGWTVTPGERVVQAKEHGLADDWPETIGARQPFGRLLTAQDAAGVVAFLASSDAAMMTGAVIDLEQYVVGATDEVPLMD